MKPGESFFQLFAGGSRRKYFDEYPAPHTILVVELDEGPRVVCNLLDLDPSDLALDLPVEIVIERRTDTIGLLDARPRDREAT